MCESDDTYASYPPKLLSWRQPVKELQRNLILIPSTFNHFSIYLASTPKCAVVQMYRFYRMYRKSDINICVKKTATIQKVVCSINLQKQESVSVGHILTVTKNSSMTFAYSSKLYDSKNLFNCIWMYPRNSTEYTLCFNLFQFSCFPS